MISIVISEAFWSYKTVVWSVTRCPAEPTNIAGTCKFVTGQNGFEWHVLITVISVCNFRNTRLSILANAIAEVPSTPKIHDYRKGVESMSHGSSSLDFDRAEIILGCLVQQNAAGRNDEMLYRCILLTKCNRVGWERFSRFCHQAKNSFRLQSYLNTLPSKRPQMVKSELVLNYN